MSWFLQAASSAYNRSITAVNGVYNDLTTAVSNAAVAMTAKVAAAAATALENLSPPVIAVQTAARPLTRPVRIMPDADAERLLTGLGAAIGPVERFTQVLAYRNEANILAKSLHISPYLLEHTKPAIKAGLRGIYALSGIGDTDPSSWSARFRQLISIAIIGFIAMKAFNHYGENTSAPLMFQDLLVYSFFALLAYSISSKVNSYATMSHAERTLHIHQDQLSLQAQAEDLQRVTNDTGRALSLIPILLCLYSMYSQYNLHPGRPDIYLNPGLSGSLLHLGIFFTMFPAMTGRCLKDFSSLLTLPKYASRASQVINTLVANPVEALALHHDHAITALNSAADQAQTTLNNESAALFEAHLGTLNQGLTGLNAAISGLNIASSIVPGLNNIKNIPLIALRNTASKVLEASAHSLGAFLWGQLGNQTNSLLVPAALNFLLNQSEYLSGYQISPYLKAVPILLSLMTSGLYMRGIHTTYAQPIGEMNLQGRLTPLARALDGNDLSLLERANMIAKEGSRILYNMHCISKRNRELGASLANCLRDTQTYLTKDHLTPIAGALRAMDGEEVLDLLLGVVDAPLAALQNPAAEAPEGQVALAAPQNADPITTSYVRALGDLWASTDPSQAPVQVAVAI